MKHLSHEEALALANTSGRKRCSSRTQSGRNTLHEWSSFELPGGELLDISFDSTTSVTSCRVGTVEEFEALWDSEWAEEMQRVGT
ncbi:hypothetical protein [Paraburkholderia sp. CI3]|uniref:hypothetical protein n=1 Tax=Paraburkholderia sp. CI3 TaxID=2991060 RepID=UPI003D20DE72